MKISLLHATARFPEAALIAANKWISRASGKIELEHILGLDYDCNVDGHHDLIFAKPSLRKSSVEAWNNCAARSTGDILVQISDDMTPTRDWDQQIYNMMDPAQKQVLGFEPVVKYGCQGGLLTLLIMTRKYYEHLGYLMYPLYPSVYSDTDATQMAMLEDVLLDAYDHFIVHHDHDQFRDDTCFVHENSNNYWRLGEIIYSTRRKQQFPMIECVSGNFTPSTMIEFCHMLLENRGVREIKREGDLKMLREKYRKYNSGRMKIDF